MTRKRVAVIGVAAVGSCVLGASIAVAVSSGSGHPVSTVGGCTTAYEQQVAYSESHPGSGKTMTTPAACSGLDAQELQVAAAAAVAKEMP